MWGTVSKYAGRGASAFGRMFRSHGGIVGGLKWGEGTIGRHMGQTIVGGGYGAFVGGSAGLAAGDDWTGVAKGALLGGAAGAAAGRYGPRALTAYRNARAGAQMGMGYSRQEALRMAGRSVVANVKRDGVTLKSNASLKKVQSSLKNWWSS